MLLAIGYLLQPVFGGAQKAIGVGEILDRVPGQMTALAEDGEDVEDPPVAELRLSPAAHHLEGLPGELDLADPARTELYVVVQSLALDLVGDQGLHVANGFQHSEVEIAPIDERAQALEYRLTASLLTGDGAGANERVAFPVAAVALVVVFEGVEVQRHWAAGAEGAQSHVDTKYEACVRAFAQDLDQSLTESPEVLVIGEHPAPTNGGPGLGKTENEIDIR